jgi:hypothetical protein
MVYKYNKKTKCDDKADFRFQRLAAMEWTGRQALPLTIQMDGATCLVCNGGAEKLGSSSGVPALDEGSIAELWRRK